MTMKMTVNGMVLKMSSGGPRWAFKASTTAVATISEISKGPTRTLSETYVHGWESRLSVDAMLSAGVLENCQRMVDWSSMRIICAIDLDFLFRKDGGLYSIYKRGRSFWN